MYMQLRSHKNNLRFQPDHTHTDRKWALFRIIMKRCRLKIHVGLHVHHQASLQSSVPSTNALGPALLGDSVQSSECDLKLIISTALLKHPVCTVHHLVQSCLGFKESLLIEFCILSCYVLMFALKATIFNVCGLLLWVIFVFSQL